MLFSECGSAGVPTRCFGMTSAVCPLKLTCSLGVFTVDSNGRLRDSLKNSLRNAMLAPVHRLFNTGLKLSQTIFLV